MIAKNIMRKDVVSISSSATVRAASILMRDEGIGALVVTDKHNEAVGIITDRDIIVSVVAAGKETEQTSVEELTENKLVNRKLITVTEDANIFEILRALGDNAVRRVPVLSNQELVGIISVDDIVSIVASELANLAAALSSKSKLI